MKLRPSLFRHLLAWALGALLVVWATFVFFAYRTGLHEADELTDGHLAGVASLLLTQSVTEFASAPDAAALSGLTNMRAHDYQQSLSVVIWDGRGKLVARTGEAPTPVFSEVQGRRSAVSRRSSSTMGQTTRPSAASSLRSSATRARDSGN